MFLRFGILVYLEHQGEGGKLLSQPRMHAVHLSSRPGPGRTGNASWRSPDAPAPRGRSRLHTQKCECPSLPFR